MLKDNPVTATIAVKDVGAARKFYEGVLGLTPDGEPDAEVANYKSGGASVFIYRSAYAGTNQATSATWKADGDIEAEVQRLKEKGVKFEHYNLQGMTQKGDIHIAEGGKMKAAWFKDPDGNILALVSE
jgi:catechol 2,3-dioxygenase-like lactoylglutathione lyase family enzyme